MRPCIATRDLVLGKADFEDWTALYRNVWSSAESARYMLWNVTASEADARERMRRTLAFQAEHEAYTVYLNGEAIGFAGMMEIAPGTWEDTGAAVGPRFTRRGYGPQILAALTERSFALGGTRFICTCRRENAPSRKVILRCGFTFDHAEDRVDPRNDEAFALEFYSKNLR